MELLLASNNRKKIAELQQLLPMYKVIALREIGYTENIEEPFLTFKENAWIKANTLFEFCGKPVLADDSGICVDALIGAPGVHSARYSGENASDEDNNEKLLKALQNESNRKAHYIAVLCLIVDGVAHYFEGQCDGSIALEPAGTGGFGYDPLFIPEGYSETFGQLSPDVKKLISHRSKALEKLLSSGLLPHS
jgi:XTP/dITP diphosphohydrolase